MTADQLVPLSLALDAAGQVIAGVRDDQWTAPTPCPDWNVRELVSHIVAGNYLFAGVLNGAPPGPPPDAPRLDDDLPGRYRDSASALVTAFGQPGVLERIVTIPLGSVPGVVALNLRIAEALVHGWDVARATGQPATFPEDVAEEALAFSRGALAMVPPGRSPFGPPQPVADDAPAIDRLAACLGRDVTTAPGW